MRPKKNHKSRFWWLFAGTTLAVGAATIVASCGVSLKAKQDLFQTTQGEGFSTSPQGDVKTLTQAALTDSSGFDALLTAELGNLLGIWYKNNQQAGIANKYKNFVTQVDDAYNDTVDAARSSSRADYPLRLQVDTYDGAGGTAETYKQTQLNQKLIDDFNSSLFSSLYLNYTNDAGAVITPTRNDLLQVANWTKIKFTNGGLKTGTSLTAADKVQNLNETYAQIQEQIFNRWVTEQNPNFVARTVFTNETPDGDGLKAIFDEDAIGASNLTASYAFQAFNDNTADVTSAKGMNAYKTMVGGKGLAEYVQSATNGGMIDIPNQFSGDSGERLLMTASDMFNSYDVAFTSAFVQQYLRMQKDADKDNVGSPIDPAGSSANTTATTDYNVMDNFLREPGKDPGNGQNAVDGSSTSTDPTSAYTDATATYVKLSSTLKDQGFYKQYDELSPTTNATTDNVIYNVAEVKGDTGSGSNYNDQFILARGKDGVHVIGIDGGSYYLSGGTNNSTPTRDISKQEAFLKFRALLASSNNVAQTTTYTFDLLSTLSSFWGNSKEMLWSALVKLYDQNTTSNQSNFFSLPENAEFKTAFGAAKTKIDAYVQAYAAQQRATTFQTNVATMNAKLNEWAKTYSDLEKNLTPEKVGIAAKLPYVRQADGDHFGLDQYYINLYKQTQSDSASSFSPTKGSSLSAIETEVTTRKKTLNAEAQKLVANITTTDSPEYSQNVFVSAGDDTTFNLGLNMAIGSTMSVSGVTNALKVEYFRNDPNFKSIYNFDTAAVTTGAVLSNVDQTTLTNTIRTFFKQSAWTSKSDLYAYGSWTDQASLNNIIDQVWNLQNITTQQNSDAALTWYTQLYTFMWLLENNLANFKQILSSQIQRGVQAAVSWTVPVNPTTLTDTTNTDPTTKFDANPNYMQGSTTNWYNAIMPTSSSGSQGSSTTTQTTPPAPDPYNDASNPYVYTSSNATTDRYGFNGLTTSASAAGIDSNASQAMYENYNLSGTQGALYMYGSKNDLLTYIDGINSIVELNTLVQTLQDAGNMDFSTYYQKIDDKYVLSFAEKKELVKTQVQSLQDTLFTKFTGFIGESKNDNYKDSNPVPESGNAKLTRIAAYMQQVNYQDVAKMGGEGWSSTANSDKRLGLDLSAFLGIVAQQAQDSGTQAMATNALFAKAGGRYVVNDKRLYDALGSAWVSQAKNVYK